MLFVISFHLLFGVIKVRSPKMTGRVWMVLTGIMVKNSRKLPRIRESHRKKKGRSKFQNYNHIEKKIADKNPRIRESHREKGR